jgi:hypothetical protein
MWQIKVKINGQIKTVGINGNTMSEARSNFARSDFYHNNLAGKLPNKDYEVLSVEEPK